MDIVTFPSGSLSLAASVWRPQRQDPLATVLLCHEAFGDRERWRFFSPALADLGYLAVAPDMPGHGESQGPRYYVQVQGWARDLRNIMDALEKGPFVLVGLGSGGSAALVAATQDPRVRALILLSPRVRPWRMPPATAFLWHFLRVMGFLKKLVTRRDLRISLVGLISELSLARDPQVDQELHQDPRLLEAMNRVPVPGSWDAWFFEGLSYARRVTVPTLILHSQYDQMSSLSNSRALYEAMTCPRELVILEESGHLIPLDREREIALNRIQDWLKQHLLG